MQCITEKWRNKSEILTTSSGRPRFLKETSMANSSKSICVEKCLVEQEDLKPCCKRVLISDEKVCYIQTSQ